MCNKKQIINKNVYYNDIICYISILILILQFVKIIAMLFMTTRIIIRLYIIFVTISWNIMLLQFII